VVRVSDMTDQQVDAPAPPVLIEADELTLIELDIVHRTRLVERGPFVLAQCLGCGWETFARRSRPLARREGRDHEILHAH
jgi:hypothetical protein